MSRIFTAGPIDFEGIDSLIEYRTRMHSSLRERGHEPVDQYTEFLETIQENDITNAMDLSSTSLDLKEISDEPFIEVIGHALAATSFQDILESPESVPSHTPDRLLDDLVERDLELLRSCDGLLAYLPRPSCGTMVEILRASEEGLPVVLVSESPPHYPRRFADVVEPTLSAGLDRIDTILESTE